MPVSKQPRPLKMTYVTSLVLQAIHHGYRYGFEIMDASGLADGTVYPALRRLEAGGLLASDWEDAEAARAAKRPARRYYELTASGERALQRARERFHGLAVAMVGTAEPVS